MKENDLYLAQQHQRQMLDIADRSRLARATKGAGRLNLWDYALLHTGEALISLGEKLRSASDYTKPVDLSQECA